MIFYVLTNVFRRTKHFQKYIRHNATADGKLVTGPKLEAEALNNQFQIVFTKETEIHPNETSPQLPYLDEIIITQAGVLKLLKNINNIVNNMQQGLETDLCILDFLKACDKVGHNRLIQKLKWYGIDGKVNN